MKKMILLVLLLTGLSAMTNGQGVWFNSPKNGSAYEIFDGKTYREVPLDVNYYRTDSELLVLAKVKVITEFGVYEEKNRSGSLPSSFNLAPGSYHWTVELWELADDAQSWVIMASQTIDFTVKCNISIENNFGNGIIKVEGSDQNSGIKVKKFIGENISVGAIDQNDGTFNRVWVSSGLNPSKWMRRLYNLNSEPIPGTNTRDYNYTVQGNEGGGAIIADLLRVYNVTFSNQLTDAPSNGVIIMGGTEYPSPLSAPCPERNGVAVEAKSYYYFGGSMEYIFDHWSNGATTTGTTGNAVNPQNSYVAVYKQRPRFYQDTRNLTFPSGAGGLRLQWNEHPNPGVTKYQIWRQIHSVDGRKITEPQELIATVNRGTTTYQDYSYTKNRYGVEYQIWYDVRAYFAPDTTISIPDAELTTAYWLGMDKKGSEQEKAMVVEDYAIDNYPNPFNPSTTIRYAVKEDGLVTLKVYDILGKEISTLVNETKTKGIYTVSFGGSDLPSGIYFYSISVNDYTATKKMMLTK